MFAQKIVIPHEQFYDTFMIEYDKRDAWKDFAEYKRFMKDKYYVEEAVLDLLFVNKDDDNGDKKDDTTKPGGDTIYEAPL